MTREEQYEVLRMTYIFEQMIGRLSNDIRSLKSNKPVAPRMPIEPVEPQENKVKVTPLPYPEIIPPEIKSESKPDEKMDSKNFVKKHGVGLMFGGALYAGLMVKNAMDESKQKAEQKKRMIEEIRNSQEYKEKCLQIDEENRLRQEAMDKKLHEEFLREYEIYKKALYQYNEELEKYHNDLEEYNGEIIPDWRDEIEAMQIAIDNAENAKRELYAKNVLPIPYQNVQALAYIVSYMATSESSLEYIIERYDKYVEIGQAGKNADEMKRILQAILSEQQYANYQNGEMIDLITTGNASLKSISSLQKFDFGLREYRRIKAKRSARKHK